MKTLKNTIAALLTITSIACFGLNLKTTPILKPNTNFNQPFGSKKPPIFQIGDWNSAGAPMPPYIPPYEYSYKCQAQLSDELRRTDASGESYQFFAIADFELNNKSNDMHTEKLEWFGKKFYNVDKILDTQDPLPFSVEGSSAYLSIHGGYQGREDQIALHATLKQKIGSLSIFNSNKSSGSRLDSGITTSVYMSLESDTQKEIPRMMMRVLCTKDK